jgi:hypothetical protein
MLSEPIYDNFKYFVFQRIFTLPEDFHSQRIFTPRGFSLPEDFHSQRIFTLPEDSPRGPRGFSQRSQRILPEVPEDSPRGPRGFSQRSQRILPEDSPENFTPRGFYSQRILLPEDFTPRGFYPQRILLPEDFKID